MQKSTIENGSLVRHSSFGAQAALARAVIYGAWRSEPVKPADLASLRNQRTGLVDVWCYAEGCKAYKDAL